MRRIAITLLAVWLVLTGLLALVPVSFPQAGLVLGLLALAAGLLLLLDQRGGRASGQVGFILLGVWLVLQGLLPLVNITIPSIDIILALLALAAGVFILLRGERL